MVYNRFAHSIFLVKSVGTSFEPVILCVHQAIETFVPVTKSYISRDPFSFFIISVHKECDKTIYVPLACKLVFSLQLIVAQFFCIALQRNVM